MGKLFVMPLERMNQSVSNRAVTEAPLPAPVPSGAGCPGSNLQLWLSAPRERNPSFAAVYSNVSYAIQSTLRTWVSDWLRSNPEAIERKAAAYPLLAFSCTRPFRGRTCNLFTYDVQQTSALDQALRTANRMMADQLRFIQSVRQPKQRVVSKQVSEFVSQKRQSIYRMFHVETMLMDEILKFTQINIPKLGLEKAAEELRIAFERQLRRFTDEFDMSARADELIAVATEALRSGNIDDQEVQLAA